MFLNQKNNRFFSSYKKASKLKINHQTRDHVRIYKYDKLFSSKWQSLKSRPLRLHKIKHSGILTTSLNNKWISKRYRNQLRRSQALKAYYGSLKDKNFKRYLSKAVNSSQNSPEESLIFQLETRLDSVIFRSGWFRSIFEVRQIILHGHFEICKLRLNSFQGVQSPSYRVSPGEFIRLVPSQLGRVTETSSAINEVAYLKKFRAEGILFLVSIPLLTNVFYPFRLDLEDVINWGRRWQ